MIQVLFNPRSEGGYVALDGPLAYFVRLSRTGAVVLDGGPPDEIPDDIAQAVAAFVMNEGAREVKH